MTINLASTPSDNWTIKNTNLSPGSLYIWAKPPRPFWGTWRPAGCSDGRLRRARWPRNSETWK